MRRFCYDGPIVLGCRAALVVLVLLAPVAARAEQLRVSIGPMEQVNLSPTEAERFRRVLLRVVQATHGLAVGPALDRLPCEPREGSCLRQLRRRLKGDRLLLLRVGRLADTTVIRLTVHDLARGVRQGSWQEVLKQGAGAAQEGKAVERMVAGFAPRPPSPSRPWYGRWWVWTLAGVVVAGTVTATVLATRSSDPKPYITIPWPP